MRDDRGFIEAGTPEDRDARADRDGSIGGEQDAGQPTPRTPPDVAGRGRAASRARRRKPRRETRRVDELHHSPWRDFFDADSGQDHRDPTAPLPEDPRDGWIEVLPDNAAGVPANTVLGPPEILHALQDLGMARVPVIVRYDLAEATRDNVEMISLMAAMRVREDDYVERARIFSRMREVVERDIAEQPDESEDLPEAVGRGDAESVQAIVMPEGMTFFSPEETERRGRNSFARAGGFPDHAIFTALYRVSQTPAEVRAAWTWGALPLDTAARVSTLDADVQERIATRIRAGEPADLVVAELLPFGRGVVEHLRHGPGSASN